MTIIFIFSLIPLVIFVYFYFHSKYNYWRTRGIPCVPGIIPVFGHMWSLVTLKESFPTLCERIYQQNENSSMVGFYQFKTPTLLIRDSELAKMILVTNFSNFGENQILLDPHLDPSMSKNPFFARKEDWKSVRSVMTTGFSSSKLKSLFLSTRDVSFKLRRFLLTQIDRRGKEVELVEFWNRYTGEFVAHVGFGLEGHCFESDDNFERIISVMFGSSILARTKEMLSFYSPGLAKLLRIRRVPKELELFFRDSIKDVITRRNSQEHYDDFLQMMIEHQKTHGNGKIDEKNLLIYLEGFLLDAYESASISLSFLCLQLALYPKIQHKVRQEIVENLKKYNGQLCYELLNDLNYMEQVLYESLRMNATIPLLSKRCTEECEISAKDGLSCKISPDVIVLISLYGLHMDAKYWPNPQTFDPERFSEREKEKRSTKFTFLPFGEGPRMCVGRRMAMIEMKLALIQLLLNCSLEISSKTELPIKRDLHFSTTPKSGLWVKLKLLS